MQTALRGGGSLALALHLFDLAANLAQIAARPSHVRASGSPLEVVSDKPARLNHIHGPRGSRRQAAAAGPLLEFPAFGNELVPSHLISQVA